MSDPQGLPPYYPPPPHQPPHSGQPHPYSGQPNSSYGQPPSGGGWPPPYPPPRRGSAALIWAIGGVAFLAVATVAALEIAEVIDIFPSSSPVRTYGAPSNGTGASGIGGGTAAVVVPENASFLVGRWGRQPDCAQVLEFRADGTATNHKGEPATWSAQGSPPRVTLAVPGSTLTGSLEQTSDGVRITGAAPGQVMNLYRCGSSAAGSGGNAAMSSSNGTQITSSSMVGFWSRTDCTQGLRLNADGSFTNRWGDRGRWSLGKLGSRTTLNQSAGGNTLTEYLDRIDDDTMRLRHIDGSSDVTIRRCPAPMTDD